MKIIKKIVNTILKFFFAVMLAVSVVMLAVPFAFVFFLYPEPKDENDKKNFKGDC